MKTMIIALLALCVATTAVAPEAKARVNTREGAYATKINANNLEPIYAGELGYVDPARNPWRTVSQGKWARDIDPEIRKDSWSLTANADYDGDGKPDMAQIYINGQQTAVIVKFGNAKPPTVIFKTDGITTGAELFTNGKRFIFNVPELGYQLLAFHQGKPVVVTIGD